MLVKKVGNEKAGYFINYDDLRILADQDRVRFAGQPDSPRGATDQDNQSPVNVSLAS